MGICWTSFIRVAPFIFQVLNPQTFRGRTASLFNSAASHAEAAAVPGDSPLMKPVWRKHVPAILFGTDL